MSRDIKQEFRQFVDSLTADKFSAGWDWEPRGRFRLSMQNITSDGEFYNYHIQINGKISTSSSRGEPQGTVANVLVPIDKSASLDIDLLKDNFVDSSQPLFEAHPGTVRRNSPNTRGPSKCQTIKYEPRPVTPFSKLVGNKLTQEFIDNPIHHVILEDKLELECQRQGLATVVSIKEVKANQKKLLAKVVNKSGGVFEAKTCQELLKKSRDEGGRAELL